MSVNRQELEEAKALEMLTHGVQRIRSLSAVGVLAFTRAGESDDRAAGLFAAIGEYVEEVEAARMVLVEARDPDKPF